MKQKQKQLATWWAFKHYINITCTSCIVWVSDCQDDNKIWIVNIQLPWSPNSSNNNNNVNGIIPGELGQQPPATSSPPLLCSSHLHLCTVPVLHSSLSWTPSMLSPTSFMFNYLKPIFHFSLAYIPLGPSPAGSDVIYATRSYPIRFFFTLHLSDPQLVTLDHFTDRFNPSLLMEHVTFNFKVIVFLVCVTVWSVGSHCVSCNWWIVDSSTVC